MSKIEVDAIEPQSGTSLTLGASGDTLTIPSGATLVNNGTASGFGDNLEWQSSIVTAATITVTANKGYWIDTTSNTCTITLPASASVGDQIIFVDYARTWATNAVTINQNSLNFQGFTSPNPVYDTSGQTLNIVYSGATKGWIPVSDDDVANETPQTVNIEYLVVAGGGGGASSGGGAGGYRTATTTFNQGVTLTATVGAGGATATAQQVGNAGSVSSLAGSGFTTFTSAGGGAGARAGFAGGNGGSGGGGGQDLSSGAGSGNTPSTSPSQGNNGGNGGAADFGSGGGGGGAGAVGSNGITGTSANIGGAGGNGAASSITGSSVTYAGGGGGGNNTSGATTGAAAGGTGGGGNGASLNSGSGDSGTANTGGGAGGAENSGGNGGVGGSGVVILSMPDADYTGTITGSPTVATGVSGKTVLTFTGTGTYTV